MTVKSRSFENNGMIPKRHTGFGKDISPELTIIDAPENTVSLAVILVDLDVPFRKEFDHWIIWNIPKTDMIPEGLPKGEIYEPIHACQGIAWGKNVYRGPKQPFFIMGEHRYAFRVYALDCMLNIPLQANKEMLIDAMNGHVSDYAELIGRYKRD